MKSKIQLRFIEELDAYADITEVNELPDAKQTLYKYDGEVYEVLEFHNGKIECNQIWQSKKL